MKKKRMRKGIGYEEPETREHLPWLSGAGVEARIYSVEAQHFLR